MNFSKQHTWAKIEGGIAIIGITDYAQKQLTNIVFIELPQIKAQAKQNQAIAKIESVKSVSDIISPLSGEVLEVNKTLNDEPELINKDPYGKGWILKLKIKNKEEIKNLITKEEYEKLTT